MMTLPPPLQLEFNHKLEQHEKELNMPFLSTIEELAEERGAKKISQENIFDLLENRFGTLPEKLMKTIQQIDNLTSLKQLLVQTISVNSLDEFQTLINAELGVK
jgi:hypothetical protein